MLADFRQLQTMPTLADYAAWQVYTSVNTTTGFHARSRFSMPENPLVDSVSLSNKQTSVRQLQKGGLIRMSAHLSVF